jgi:phosphoribosylanthranilate isomerase
MTAKVKICGLSEPVTLNAALDAGADFIGLMFFAKSPRNVSLEQARVLADIASGIAKITTVVVDADDTLLHDIATHVKPDYIQAHGKETPARVAEIKALTGIPVVKVISVADAADIARAQSYASVAEFMMFDAKTTGPLPGGMGHAFDWSLLSGAQHPYMLAGGLRPETVAGAIAQTGAQMVDVSSGVESAPGVKDETLIRKFIEAAKATR